MVALYNEDAFQRSPSAGFDGIWDWDFLKGAFGPTIMPMDIDALVERRGHFVIFETKKTGVEIPQGQKIALGKLIELGRGHITLIVVFGKSVTESFHVVKLNATGGFHNAPYPEGTNKKLWDFCHAWYEEVEAGGTPGRVMAT